MLTMTTPEARAKHAAYIRDWHKRNPRKAQEYQLRRCYGLTLEEYDAKLEEQDGVCGCCGREFNFDRFMRDRQVDHNHETGEFRGIVCARCNYILGRVDKDVEILELCVAYLRKHRVS